MLSTPKYWQKRKSSTASIMTLRMSCRIIRGQNTILINSLRSTGNRKNSRRKNQRKHIFNPSGNLPELHPAGSQLFAFSRIDAQSISAFSKKMRSQSRGLFKGIGEYPNKPGYRRVRTISLLANL